HGREVQYLDRRLAELLIVHRGVAGAEVDGLVQQLLDSAARSDRLVVKMYIRIILGVDVEPLRIDRIRKGRAGAVDQKLAAGIACSRENRRQQRDRKCNLFY